MSADNVSALKMGKSFRRACTVTAAQSAVRKSGRNSKVDESRSSIKTRKAKLALATAGWRNSENKKPIVSTPKDGT